MEQWRRSLEHDLCCVCSSSQDRCAVARSGRLFWGDVYISNGKDCHSPADSFHNVPARVKFHMYIYISSNRETVKNFCWVKMRKGIAYSEIHHDNLPRLETIRGRAKVNLAGLLSCPLATLPLLTAESRIITPKTKKELQVHHTARNSSPGPYPMRV